MAESSIIEQKLAELGLDKSPEEFVEGLPPHLKRRIVALQDIQKQKDDVEALFRKEKAELEAKYEKLYGPFYVERKQIVTGDKDVPPKSGEDAGDASIKGIPEFWSTVLLKCDTTSEMIKDKDLEVLKYLTDIQSENVFEEGEPRGFKLTFSFDSNPFFSNKSLEKTYLMLSEDDGVLEKAVGTTIMWNPGKDVTVKVMKKKPKKGGKDAKPQTKVEKIESFFNFFSPPDVPGEDDEVEEEFMEELQALIESDYEVGATIKEKLIAKAVAWYTGEAAEDEPYYFNGDEDDEDFDDEEHHEGEEEEEEEEEPAPAPAKKGGKGGGPPAQGTGSKEQPAECKQQ